MSNIYDILNLILEHEIPSDNDMLLGEALTLLDKLSPGSGEQLRMAFLQLVARAMETSLLSDPKIRQLSLYWDVMVGQAESVIRERILETTGIEPSDAFIKYFRSCLRSHASRTGDGSKATISFDDFQMTILERLDNCQNRELRCESCGYHFLASDLGRAKMDIVGDSGGNLALTRHPGRLSDPIKPWQLPTSKGTYRSLTQLTITGGER